jgi:hypothetical protein
MPGPRAGRSNCYGMRATGTARGLAAVLDESDVIAEVTPDFIEIVKSKRSILRFQRRMS